MNTAEQKNNEKCHIEMFNVFCRLHPIEAFHLNQEGFYEFMKSEGYNLSEEEIKKIITETEDECKKWKL